MPTVIDPTLVEDAALGDARARAELMDRTVPLVLRWCARLGGPKVDAEDAAHDVCVVVLQKLPSLRDAERYPAWLFGITRRVLAGHRRRTWLRRWAPESKDAADPRPDPEQRSRLSERARAVQAALEELPARDREVLVLCDLEEWTRDEAAELLGIPSGTVRSRLRRARERFARVATRRSLAPLRPSKTGGLS